MTPEQKIKLIESMEKGLNSDGMTWGNKLVLLSSLVDMTRGDFPTKFSQYLDQLLEHTCNTPSVLHTAEVYLSRRNLLTLLSKLDRAKNGQDTYKMIGKHDSKHLVYPQTHPTILVHAVEDEEYYTDRSPGAMHPLDDPSVDKQVH